MKKMTSEDIIDLLDKLELGYIALMDDDAEDDEYEGLAEFRSSVGSYNVLKDSAVGGYEGGGDDLQRIVYFSDHNVYIKFSGSYDSNDGEDYTDCEEVFPRRVIVTAFETEKQRGDKKDEA